MDNTTLTRNKQFLIFGNILGFIITFMMNFLAVALPLNGKTTQELSDQYPNLFVPAGYVFAIWSVIYTLLLVFTIYQALPRNRDSPILEQISIWFIVSSFANSLWIVFWHYEQVFVSLILMIILLLSLIMIYTRLNIGKEAVPREVKLAVHVPFSVYLGWITIATVANITALLVSIDWDGFGLDAGIWTISVLVIATIIALTVVITRKDIAYGLVPIWAFIGILVKQIETKPDVSLVAGVCAVVISVILVGMIVKKRFMT